MTLQLSIIVCTYNRADLLRDVLQSLTCQTAPSTAYDVLVVNNNSSDSTQQIAQDFSSRFANFYVVVEPKQGLSHARNRGFKEAKTEWVAYLDDDARAHPDFVERVMHTAENFLFDCFGGVYLPWYKCGRPKWFRDEYATNGRLLDEVGVLKKGEISGGVSAFKKSVLEQLGGFPSTLGMCGNKIAYGEETLLQLRMREKGFVIGFDPEMLVDHVVSRPKMTVRWLLKSSYYHGFYYWDTYEDRATFFKLIKIMLEVGYLLLLETCRHAPHLMRREYYGKNFVIESLRLPAIRLGQLAGGIKNLLETARLR